MVVARPDRLGSVSKPRSNARAAETVILLLENATRSVLNAESKIVRRLHGHARGFSTVIGLPSIGPPSIGPPSIGLPSIGPPSIGPPSIGLPSIGLPSIGLPSIGLPSIGLPSIGLPSIGLHTRRS
ncbi:MAG: hypothetical protein HYS04_08150 [Acidobacteria bacterium]|nr:hypothetical protein [Acidobacteriota bacterium]